MQVESDSSFQLIISRSSAFLTVNSTNSSSSIINSSSNLLSISDSEIKCKPHRSKCPLILLTQNVVTTYKTCNSSFKAIHKLPRRVLTQPSEAVLNDGLDNAESNLICRVHDILECSSGKYIVLDMLGCGTFGQVFRCQKDGSKDVVAVKIIKNKPAYHTQGQLEANIARLLNQKFDVKDERHIVRLLDQFEYKGHICLVFELLSMSLLDILTQNQFRGLPLNVVQRFTRQILAALVTFQEAGVIHCDLKPENILLSPAKTPSTSASINSSSKAQLGRPGFNSTDDLMKLDMNKASLVSSMSGGFLSQLATVPEGSPVPDIKPDVALPSESVSSSGHTTHAAESPAGASLAPTASEGIQTSSTLTGADSISTAIGANSSNPRSAIWSDVKVIDLGSACFEGQTMYSYIQSRFYRSPEVLLGVPYNGSIDMWSLACVCAEMYLGLPLFPGVSQHNQLTRIVEMFGSPPDYLIDGKNGFKYFTYIGNFDNTKAAATDDDDFELSRQQEVKHRGVRETPSSTPQSQSFKAPSSSTPISVLNEAAGQKGSNNSNSNSNSKSSKYRLKTAEEYAMETKTEVPQLRKYLRYNRLEDIILKYPLVNRSKLTSEQKREEILRRHCFLNFLHGLFNVDPFQRWTAKQAANHPFVTSSYFSGSFSPQVDPRVNDRKLAFLLQIQQRRDNNRPSPLTKLPSTYSKPDPSIPLLLPVNEEYKFQALERRLSEPVYKSSNSQMNPNIRNPPTDSFTMQRGRQISPDSSQNLPVKSDAGSSEEPSPVVQHATQLSHPNHPHLQRRNTGDLIYSTGKDTSGSQLSNQPIMEPYREQQNSTSTIGSRVFTMGLGSRTMSFPGEEASFRHQEALYQKQQQQQMQRQIQYQQQQQQLQYQQQQQRYSQEGQVYQQPTTWSQTGAPTSQSVQNQSIMRASTGKLSPSKSFASFHTPSDTQNSPTSPHSIYAGSLPTNPGNFSDFGQALIRPEMDEQRYLRSQQQQIYVQQQQQQMMMSMHQQQARGIGISYNTMQTSQSSGNLRDRRFNAGITSVMGPATTTRSYENRSRTFLSQMMGTLRGSRGDSSKVSVRYDDELNQSKHAGRDRGSAIGYDDLDYSNHNQSLSGAFDDSDRMLNMSTHSNVSLDRYYSGSAHGISGHGVSAHGDRVSSAHGDRYLNTSTHSVNSVTSADFPIVNRAEQAVELERQRAGERDAHMREQVSEVERAANAPIGTTISSFWPFSSFKLSGGSSGQTQQSPTNQSPRSQRQPPTSATQPAASSSWRTTNVATTLSTSNATPKNSSTPVVPAILRTAIPVPVPTAIPAPDIDTSPRTESSRESIHSTPRAAKTCSTNPSPAVPTKSTHGDEDPDSDPFFT